MTRESAAVKARRYLGEGRLTVLEAAADWVRASCRGDGELYELGHDFGRGGWYCSCAARTDQCAHLTALRLVVVRSAALRLAASNPTTRRRSA